MSQPPFRITRVSNRTRKFIAKRDRKTQKEIAAAFDFLCAVSPFHHPNPKTIRRLHGELEGLWRYRLANIRIIYGIDEDTRSIEIVSIDDRGDVYK
ncbi:MAG: type II toxin-antitoxin system RelE/ParE family toxin [Chloroflexi bacterium]|nr:type II toxin-antitoxin system RelE/ParE family toxin [Chloroflexota bacterium]